MAEKLKDLYVRRNTGNNYGQESDSWAQRADELNRMAGGALKQGSETAGNGALGWLKDSFDAGAASVFGGTARAAGEFLPFGNETLNSWADYFDEVARNNSPQPGQELKGMDYVASAVGNALGSGGASALEAAVVGSLLGVGGAAGTALGAASRVIPGVGKAVEAGKTLWGSPVGKYLVGKVAGSPFEAVSESGNLITDMRKENQQGTANYTDDEIREAALRSGALNLAWLTGMNMLEAGTLGKITGALGGDMAAKGVKDIAKRATLGGLSSGIGEGAEEYGQNLIGDYSKRGSTADFNYDEAMEAAKMGAIGGGVLGGLGSGLSAKFSKKNSDVSEEIASEDGGTIEETPEATVSGREAFINAIAGQESGGNYNAENSDTGAYGKYQIMPSNWPAWAEEAGIGADAEMTPENQEIVARYKLGEYYDKYGARGAAIAWYAGEGALDYSEEALNRKQGKGDEPSINEYADSVLARMGNVADSARIDDSEENYFNESDYTDDAILGSLRPARGFDVSHLGDGEAQDRNSIAQFEKLSPEVGAQRDEFTRQQEIETRRKQSDALMEELRAAGNNPQRTSRYGFEQRKVSPADALAHGFEESIPENIDEQKVFNNNIQTNIMRKRNRLGNLANPTIQATPKPALPSLMQMARSPRDMANATNFALMNQRSIANKNWQQPQQVVAQNNEQTPNREAEMQRFLQVLGAAGRTPFMPNAAYNPKYQSGYVGNARRSLAAQNRVQPDALPSVEPTPVNHRALDGRNFLNDIVAAGRADYANGKRVQYGAFTSHGQYMDLPRKQINGKTVLGFESTTIGKRKLSHDAKYWLRNFRANKSEQEALRDAAISVWTGDPKHPMKECRRLLNIARNMRKEVLQPIFDNMMEQGYKQGVEFIPIEDRRTMRESHNPMWYRNYYKENGKAPSKTAMYDIAEEIFFGRDKYGVGYFSGIDGETRREAEEAAHEELDYINQAIEAYETLELKLKENPNYGKEWAEEAENKQTGQPATARNSEAEQAEAEHVPESNQDEVNKKAPALAEGYTTESGRSLDEADENEFILHKGKKNFGEITKAVADVTGGALKAAPIRLQVGNAEFGLKHLLKHEAQMQSKGFNDVYEFIDHVLKNFNQVYSQQTEKKPNRFVLYCKDDKSKGFMPIDLELKKDTDGYYTIVSAMPHKAKIKGTLVYDGSSRPSTATTDSLLSSDINGKGGDDAEIVLAKPNVPLSTQSVAQPAENVKKINLPKGTTVDVSIVGDNSNIIQVKFNGEQGKGTSGIMGRAGYKWKNDKQLWQARKTDKAMDVAEQLGYKPTEEMSEDKSQQTDKYKNYSKEDIKINKERLATMPDVDGILQPAAKKFAEFFKARFPKSDYTNEAVDFWNNYTLEFEQLNKILKKYRKAVQQGNLSMADAHFQQISSSFDRINDLLEKIVGNDKEMRQEFVDSITPVFDEYHKIVDEHNAKDNAKKTSKAKKQQGKQEYKYYLNARPADIGAVPKGFIRVDAEDKGGRYGAIYYDRQLSDKEVQQYELKSDADVAKEKAQTEAVKEVSRELLKSDKVAMQAKNNTLADFTLAYYDDIENYLADHIEENPVYADLLNDPVIIDKAIESESIIKNTYEKLRGKSSSEETTDKLSKNKKTADKQEAKQQKSNYDYGDKKAILKDLLAATGLKEKNSKVEDVEGLDYSDAGLEEALNELAKECSKLSANPMFNPALYRAAAKVGLIFLKRTGRNFKRWAKALLDWFRKNRPEEENKIKPFLGAIYKNIENWPKNLAFKEDIVELSCRLVGSSYAEGNTSFEAVYRDIVDMAGEENAQALRGYLEQAYLAVDELENPTLTLGENVVESKQDKGGSQYDSNSTESLFSDDTGFGNTGNEIRTTSEGKEPRGSNGQGSKTSERESERNGNSGVPGSRASAGGKTSVREGSQEASSTDGDASGSTGLSDSVVDSLQEQPNVNEGAVENIVESASGGRVNATDEVTQKVNEVIKENNLDKRRADRLQQTAKVMPFLTAIQLHNTDFVAERFETNGKQGVMITDGTGTGKTFSGLATVKKMVDEGKKNIIIAAPNDTIINQWIGSARDFYNLEVTRLKDTDDAGEGIVITTYANFGENEELVNRNWDMVICDESHNLMNSESGKTTNILSRLRLLTYHPTELRNRAEQTILSEDKIEARKIVRKALALKTKEPESLSAKERSIISASERIQANSEDKLTKEETAQIEAQAKEWEELNESEKPKVMFLSATPFAYVNDIDYANGYLFDYPKLEGQGYNQPNGLQQFLMEHFGYRMRYNKLTKPDGSVDNALMEMEFHEWLRNTGALTGHELEIDKDYNRGFILVDQGVGRQIDEGFEFLRENKEKYGNLEEVLNKQFDGRRRNYLLESIKARASVPIIREYLKAGKKVVVFHETNVERESFNPFRFTKKTMDMLDIGGETAQQIKHEWELFAKARPDLVNLNLDELSEPRRIYEEAFGDEAMFFNGRVPKKNRAQYVAAFNNDNSGKNLIIVQQDAGNAGISLHDTTGKHPRVEVNINIPRRPSFMIQIDGRIYRLGCMSNAIIRYLTTGTNIENHLFASTVAGRTSTAENLALGRKARGLRDSIIDSYQKTLDGTWVENLPGAEGEDVGGKESDRNMITSASDYDRAKGLYYGRGKKTAKTKAAEGVDYFATPEPIGYKMVQWANVKAGDKILEPSAGHGAISRFFSPTTENTIIEPSDRLAPQAQMNTENAKLINGVFEDLHISNKYDAITMNPPFGTGGKTAIEHLSKAFRHLREGGRVIALIPRGGMADKRFTKWYESDEAKNAHMVGEVLLPNVTFERAGTKVATRIVIIDKGGESQGVKRIDLSRINNINELFDNLESVEMPARQTKQTDVGAANFANSLRKGDAEGNSEVVTADSYKHTKTGAIIPSAKLNANLSDEEYRKVKSIAGKNGGYYSRYAKAFLFQDNENGRDKFVEEVNGADNTQYSVSSEAVQRVKKEIDEEIRKALPGAKMLPMSGDAYLVELPNGKTIFVKIAEEIIQKGESRKKALKDHNLSDDKDLVVGGFWQKWENLDGKSIDGILAVSIEGSEGTAFHESLHAAMDLCLNEKEKAALYKYYAKKAKESGRVIDEEIADGYKEWALKRQRGQGSMFGKLFQKVTDFLNKLYTMFAKANNKGNIFRKLESGEAWKQQGEKSSQGTQYAVTNNAITGETRVPVIDVTDLPQIDVNSASVKKEIAQSLIGKTFNIIGTNGIGKIANVKDGRHFVGGSNNKTRTHETRRKSLAVAEKILNNSVYIEKHIDANHDTQSRYIELYAVARNGDKAYRMRIVAKEGDRTANEYEVKTAKFYDIIEEGTLPALASQMDANQQSNVPSTVSVADLLDGVKGRDGKLLVNKNGGLNYNSEIFKGIKEPADYSVKYSVASPKHKIANAFTNTERKGVVDSAKDFFKEHRKSLYQDWFDKNNPLKGFDALTKATGGLSVYDQVQSLPATTAGMLKALTEGTAQHVKMANQHLKNVKMKYNVTLAMALEKIDKKQMDKAYPKYLAENGFDNWVNALGAYLGAERCLEMARLARAEGKTYKFPKGLTEQECQDFVNKAPQQFKAAADIFYKVNDNVISIMEDAEVFSHDLAKTLRTKYRKYCPLLRDFSDTAAADSFIGGLTEGGRGIGNVSVPLKRINIEGSERGVLNPLETILKSYAVMLNRAERNKVALMAVENSRTADLHELIQEVPGTTADPKNCVFTVLINGKKKAYKTTQDLYGPIVGYNLPAANLAFGVARTAARMLRTGATMSPSFILRNVLRDTVFAGVSSKNGFIPIVDTIRGAIALAKDPAMRAEFEAAGVTEYNFYSSQKSRIKSLDAMAGETPASAWEIMKAVFSRLEATSDFFESSTRMGEYMKARQKGLSMEEAARAAREVTLDFSRSGRIGEQVNQVVPFFNACLQGGDKMVRLFREDFVGTSQKVFKYIVLPSLLIMAMNWDEDWYKDLDPDIKNNYWCLGRNIRIPKPQEAGVLFGSGVEALFQQAADKDKDAVSNFLKAFSSNMIPSVLPTVILPLIEWSANYSFFKGRPLVGNKYSRLPDELQYNDYTSELSKGIGSALKVSPMKIDNLVRGYTGTMGALLWSMAGEPFAKANNLPAKHFSELPFVRDFNVTDANLSRPMNEFYGILDKANRQHAGYGVKGKPEAAVKGIRSAGSMISKIRKDIDKITHSNLTPERKRELIDKRKEKMNQIAKQANTRYGKYFD